MSNPPVDRGKPPPLRHPLEMPVYIICVVLNVLIAVVLFAGVVIELAPTPLHALVIGSSPLRLAVVAVLIACLLAGLALIAARQLNRASVRGSSVLAGDRQFAQIEQIKREAAAVFRFPPQRQPEIYVEAGNGVLNAFAASAFGHDFVVVNSDLFANTFDQNVKALRFIIGHELGHIRLGHTRLWNQISIAYSSLVPLLGAYLSRLRELSCDRHGARFESEGGEEGLILLTAGRYIYHDVQMRPLLDQAQRNVGFWNTVVQLPMSHPLTLRRIRELNRRGMLHEPPQPGAGQPHQTRARPTSG